MEKDTERYRSFTRRAIMIGAFQGGILALLGGRLGWLQLAEGQRYRTLSDKNRINIQMIPPSRGQILDRYGVPLAVNAQNFQVLVIPEQTDNLEKALFRLQKLIPLEQREIEKVLREAKRSSSFAPLEVKDNLSWEDVAKIEVNLPDLPGLSIDVGEIRQYPRTDSMAHLVGYVGSVTKADLAKARPEDAPVLSLPGFRMGRTGLERFYEDALRGKAGAAEVEVNVLGREVRELRRSPGIQGKELKLTIDAELQDFVQKKLAEQESASAVVMDVHTGAVYAMGSVPSFDPNLFTYGLPADKWEQLLADPRLPLNNKAIGGVYPPGSTFKMVTALAALEEGVIDANYSTVCTGKFTMGTNIFHCWKPSGHGRVWLGDALMQSCDTFFYSIAADIGINRIAKYATMLGLGSKLGIEMPEEKGGLVPTKEWKMRQHNRTWQQGETVIASIGQGYLETTPLQLAVMTARLCNGGYAVKPWVTASLGDSLTRPPIWPKLPVQAQHLNLIRQGMEQVISNQHGTAHGSRILTEGMQMAGKTGTAQVRRITMKQRAEGVKNEDLPWIFRHHALFVGYAPAQNPRYACCVVVEHGVGGGVSAAPIARDIMEMVQRRNPASSVIVPGKAVTAAPPLPVMPAAPPAEAPKEG